jgi:hypothetical protein
MKFDIKFISDLHVPLQSILPIEQSNLKTLHNDTALCGAYQSSST